MFDENIERRVKTSRDGVETNGSKRVKEKAFWIS
jgi:hypothetical protein